MFGVPFITVVTRNLAETLKCAKLNYSTCNVGLYASHVLRYAITATLETLWARHAIFPSRGEARDEPQKSLRKRLDLTTKG